MFWRSGFKQEPVREWLRELSMADRAVIGADLRRLQFGWPIGMPLVRPLGGGLWELRSSLPGKRETRIMFAIGGDIIVALHGFIKKSRKTPPQDLALARKRMKELQS
ncbi:MAG: type II toxin-antitoxin system RelE/ParE family toxin [Methylocella sp.]